MRSKEYKSLTTAMQEIRDLTMSEIAELKIGSDKDKLTSKQIAKKIKKMKGKLPTLKDFEQVFAKFNPKELHSRQDLEGMLPDYVAGKEIGLLFAEEIEDIDESDVVAGDAQGTGGRPFFKGTKKDKEDMMKPKGLEENASMSSINDLVQSIKSKQIVYADVTQTSSQGHKFYLKGKPEIKAGDILLRMANDKSQFVQIKIEQIKDIKTSAKAVSIYLKK